MNQKFTLCSESSQLGVFVEVHISRAEVTGIYHFNERNLSESLSFPLRYLRLRA